jgi:hypothetical protein
MNNFNESDHPRDGDGKFAKGGLMDGMGESDLPDNNLGDIMPNMNNEREDEDEEQAKAKGVNTVNWTEINKHSFDSKFNVGSEKTNKVVTKLAREILNHRQNTNYEDMHIIEIESGKLVTSEVNILTEFGVNIPNRQQIVAQYPHNSLATIHNHPNSLPPSPSDIAMSLSEKQCAKQVIVCHDGTVYIVTPLRKNIMDKQLTFELLKEYIKGRETAHNINGAGLHSARLETLKDLEVQKWVSVEKK